MRSYMVAVAVLLAGFVATARAQQGNTTKAGQSKTIKAVAQQEERPELAAVGGLGASNMYTSFLALGAIRDNFISGTYDAETSMSLVQVISSLLASSIEQLRAVQESTSVSDGDAVFLKDMVDTYATLRSEAQSLASYVQTGDTADDEQFQQEREKAWGQISRLLNLK